MSGDDRLVELAELNVRDQLHEPLPLAPELALWDLTEGHVLVPVGEARVLIATLQAMLTAAIIGPLAVPGPLIASMPRACIGLLSQLGQPGHINTPLLGWAERVGDAPPEAFTSPVTAVDLAALRRLLERLLAVEAPSGMQIVLPHPEAFGANHWSVAAGDPQADLPVAHGMATTLAEAADAARLLIDAHNDEEASDG